MEIHLSEDTRPKEWVIKEVSAFSGYSICQNMLNSLEEQGYKIFKVGEIDRHSGVSIIAYRYKDK
jgi:hypothetical protein